ncbi:unnamed protein product [Dovyalis caffra]|uniref:Uncharacterized protein n=1 Tax=Dovyalis caffra TaxID=77055 RepID=A0AAV1SHT1_9ROSI|nr:unnamed protein product [Dovyalis caffra]
MERDEGNFFIMMVSLKVQALDDKRLANSPMYDCFMLSLLLGASCSRLSSYKKILCLAHKKQPHPLVILRVDFSSCPKVQRLAS